MEGVVTAGRLSVVFRFPYILLLPSVKQASTTNRPKLLGVAFALILFSTSYQL